MFNEILICCSLQPFSTPQYKKLGPGPAKVPKDPKNPFIEDKSFNTLILGLLGL